MKLFRYVADSDRYNSLLIKKEDYGIWDIINNSSPIGKEWNPVKVIDFKAGKTGDFPSLYTSIPVFSKKALVILKEYIDNDIEALPLLHSKRDYYAINVINVLDCLNVDESIIMRNPVTNDVSTIKKYDIDYSKIESQYIFKLPETQSLEVLVTERFKDLVESNNLVGLNFSRCLYETTSSTP